MATSKELARRDERLPEKTGARPTVAPAVDIYENSNEILMVADVPGVAKDGVSVHLDKEVLTLEARRSDHEEKGLMTAEYRAQDYFRAFTLPQGIDPDKIEARLDNGVLRLHLPKAAASRPRRIEIKAS